MKQKVTMHINNKTIHATTENHPIFTYLKEENRPVILEERNGHEYYAKFPSISSTDTPFVSEIKAGDITWFEGWHALSIATTDVSIAPHTVNYLGHIEEELDLTTAKIQLEVADIENS